MSESEIRNTRALAGLAMFFVMGLSLFGCSEARGYGVLQSLKSIDVLVLPQSYRSLPDG